MIYKPTLMKLLFSLMIIILFAGCSGGDSDSDGMSAGGQGLTAEYVEKELQIEGYATVETSVIYEGDPQSSTYEFKRIIISKVTNADGGESLAYAYSLVHPPVIDNTRFVAFYIDVDNDPNTGESIEGIGADRLLLDTTIFESSPFDGQYFIWSEAQSQWGNQPINGTSLVITDQESGSTSSINVPFYANIDDLFGLSGAKGVFAVRVFTTGNPGDINAATLAATTVFTFNTPM